MKIPTKIKVGCYEFEINKLPRLWEDSSCRGRFSPVKACIDLAEDMPEQYKFEVFIHETLEAVKWSYNLDIIHQDLNILSMVLSQVIQSIEREEGNNT